MNSITSCWTFWESIKITFSLIQMVSEASAAGNCCSISENCHYITVIITSIGKIKETVYCFEWRPCFTSTVAHVIISCGMSEMFRLRLTYQNFWGFWGICICSWQLLETFWQNVKLLIMSSYPICHNIFNNSSLYGNMLYLIWYIYNNVKMLISVAIFAKISLTGIVYIC